MDRKKEEERIERICSICQKLYIGWGNNAQPVNDGRCCNSCDWNIVIPARVTIVVRERGK